MPTVLICRQGSADSAVLRKYEIWLRRFGEKQTNKRTKKTQKDGTKQIYKLLMLCEINVSI